VAAGLTALAAQNPQGPAFTPSKQARCLGSRAHARARVAQGSATSPPLAVRGVESSARMRTMLQAKRAAQEYFSEEAMKNFEDKMMTSSFGTPADAPVRGAGQGDAGPGCLPRAWSERCDPARVSREAFSNPRKDPRTLNLQPASRE